MRFVFALGMAAAIVSGAALAQQAQPDQTDHTDKERYAVERIDENTILRVDKESGETTRCQKESGEWRCDAVTEQREALEDEIGRLATENARLRERIAELEGRPAGESGQPSLELPSREDVGRVMDYLSEMTSRAYNYLDGLWQDFNRQTG